MSILFILIANAIGSIFATIIGYERATGTTGDAYKYIIGEPLTHRIRRWMKIKK